MKLFVHKPGWAQAVGWAMSHNYTGNNEADFVFLRVVLHNFHLSQAASLFLLQGASLKQLFADVVVKVGNREPDFYSLAIADSPRLFAPPPRIPRVVLAHILERSATSKPEELFERIFMLEMKRPPEPRSF